MAAKGEGTVKKMSRSSDDSKVVLCCILIVVWLHLYEHLYEQLVFRYV